MLACGKIESISLLDSAIFQFVGSLSCVLFKMLTTVLTYAKLFYSLALSLVGQCSYHFLIKGLSFKEKAFVMNIDECCASFFFISLPLFHAHSSSLSHPLLMSFPKFIN